MNTRGARFVQGIDELHICTACVTPETLGLSTSRGQGPLTLEPLTDPLDDEVQRRTIARAGSGATARPTTKGETVPTVIAHHDVKDKDHWLASPKREEVFGRLGVTNSRTFVDPEKPTRVAVLMDVADMDVVMAAMQNEAMAEAMAYDGVLPETLVILVEA